MYAQKCGIKWPCPYNVPVDESVDPPHASENGDGSELCPKNWTFESGKTYLEEAAPTPENMEKNRSLMQRGINNVMGPQFTSFMKSKLLDWNVYNNFDSMVQMAGPMKKWCWPPVKKANENGHCRPFAPAPGGEIPELTRMQLTDMCKVTWPAENPNSEENNPTSTQTSTQHGPPEEVTASQVTTIERITEKFKVKRTIRRPPTLEEGKEEIVNDADRPDVSPREEMRVVDPGTEVKEKQKRRWKIWKRYKEHPPTEIEEEKERTIQQERTEQVQENQFNGEEDNTLTVDTPNGTTDPELQIIQDMVVEKPPGFVPRAHLDFLFKTDLPYRAMIDKAMDVNSER